MADEREKINGGTKTLVMGGKNQERQAKKLKKKRFCHPGLALCVDGTFMAVCRVLNFVNTSFFEIGLILSKIVRFYPQFSPLYDEAYSEDYDS